MILASINFICASVLFGIWVNGNFKDGTAAGLFMFNLLIGIQGIANYFK